MRARAGLGALGLYPTLTRMCIVVHGLVELRNPVSHALPAVSFEHQRDEGAQDEGSEEGSEAEQGHVRQRDREGEHRA
jgi:hypothetical protein